MEFPDDAGLIAVLTSFGVQPDARLGHGGEAWVYALDDTRVLRVLHAGGRAEDLRDRERLVDELALGRPTFALPRVIDVGELDGRIFAIEQRLPGRSVLEVLQEGDAASRARLIEAHLEAAAALGDLHLEPRDGFGDLIGDHVITAPTWREYLEQRAAANLARSVPDLRSIDATALAGALPEAAAPAFVHLDAFTGNMLTDGRSITAVIDVGPTSAVGDRRLDPVAAAVYLAAPEITGTMAPADIDVARSWLRAARLDDWFDPARRWLAAYWSFAVDDPRVLAWSRSVLLD